MAPPELAEGPGSLFQRVRRCMTVSVFTTVISVSTLLTFTLLFGVEAWIANVIATSVATVPSFHLNRRWTWARRDAAHPWREVVPFWILAFAGLALSTVTVSIANSWAASTHLSPVLREVAIVGGHLGGFALLWVAQFVILDRVLFADPAQISGVELPGPASTREMATYEA